MINFNWTDVDKIIPDADDVQTFLPKPFVFEGMMSGASTKVYLPGQTYTAFMDGLPLGCFHLYACVHLCKQFQDYPTTKFGIRVIPKNAQCPFGGRCHGANLMCNGKPIYKSINMSSELIDGLTKPEKTR